MIKEKIAKLIDLKSINTLLMTITMILLKSITKQMGWIFEKH